MKLPPTGATGKGAPSPGPDVIFLWMLCALISLALNLRSPLTAVPPVVGEIRADLGVSSAVIGLLTSIPVLCFGLLTPLASLLISRIGIQIAIFVTLGGAAIGLGLRPYAGVPGMLAGTLLIGASLAIGNIVSLMIIARDFSHRMSVVTGVYTAALNIGTMLTGALTAPLALIAGWRFALASWVWLAVLAMLLWWKAGRLRRVAAESEPPVQVRSASAHAPLWRRPIVWLLSLAFTAHLFIYYAITAWLPAYLIEADGMSAPRAGLVAAAFQALSLAGAFGAPLLAKRFSLGWQLAAMGILWLITPAWMLWAPHQWLLWSITGGIAQGGTFVLIFMLVMRHAVSLDDNRRLSTVVQGVGYSLASFGPIVVGWLHESLGRWNDAWLLLAALSLALVAAGIAITRISSPTAQ